MNEEKLSDLDKSDHEDFTLSTPNKQNEFEELFAHKFRLAMEPGLVRSLSLNGSTMKRKLSLSMSGKLDRAEKQEVFRFDDIFRDKSKWIIYPDDKCK